MGFYLQSLRNCFPMYMEYSKLKIRIILVSNIFAKTRKGLNINKINRQKPFHFSLYMFVFITSYEWYLPKLYIFNQTNTIPWFNLLLNAVLETFKANIRIKSFIIHTDDVFDFPRSHKFVNHSIIRTIKASKLLPIFPIHIKPFGNTSHNFTMCTTRTMLLSNTKKVDVATYKHRPIVAAFRLSSENVFMEQQIGFTFSR